MRLTAGDLFHGLEESLHAAHLERLDHEPPLVQYQLAFHGPPGLPLGDPPVLVVGALAASLRQLTQLAAVPRGQRDAAHDVDKPADLVFAEFLYRAFRHA